MLAKRILKVSRFRKGYLLTAGFCILGYQQAIIVENYFA